jgi:hypothetical protein
MNNPSLTPSALAVGDHLQRIREMAAQADAKPSIRQMLLHISGQETMTYMEPAEVFDECIVGCAEQGGRTVAVYNKMAVIAALAASRDISPEQAFVMFQDSFGATAAQREIADVPPMPIFVVDIRDI